MLLTLYFVFKMEGYGLQKGSRSFFSYYMYLWLAIPLEYTKQFNSF